jgi:hypothetical protein
MATKKKSAKRVSDTRPLSSADAKKLVKIDTLSKSVATAVTKALARQDLSKLRGPILCGIIYRPNDGSFQPLFKEQGLKR